MKISLRKAAQMINDINIRIGELTLPTEKRVNFGQNVNVTDCFNEAQSTFQSSVEAKLVLTDTAFAIRQLVSVKNQSVGINSRLNKLAAISRKLDYLSGLTTKALRGDAAESVDEFVGRYQTNMNRFTGSTEYGVSDSISFTTVSKSFQNIVAGLIAELRKQKNVINDEIAALNVKTLIELDETSMSVLTKYQVI